MQMKFDGLSNRADSEWARVGMVLRVGPMFFRGLLRKPWFATSRGFLFVGRRTRISYLRGIHHTGRLVVEDGAEIQGLAKQGLRFGDDVSIGAGCMIRPSSYYGGEVGEGLLIGNRSSMGAGCFIGCSGLIEIGDDVMLGPGVRIFSENHVYESTGFTIKSQGVERGVVKIGDDCWIASGVTITAGVTIGRGVIVGAGSVVTKDLPDYCIAAGSPARVIRTRE